MKTKTVIIWLSIATALTLALTTYYIFSLDKEVKPTQGVIATEGEAAEPVNRLSTEELRELEEKSVSDSQFESVKEYISLTHDFYNETTGYGGIKNLDYNVQNEKAIDLILYANYYIEIESDNKDLVKDLKAIKKLALRFLEKPRAKDVKSLHRYFHDLDIALNQYSGHDKVWGVTEVYGKGK